MDNSRIWVLMGKKLAGELSAEELAEWEELLKNNPDVPYLMETFTALWKPSDMQALKEQQPDESANDLFAWHISRLAKAGYDMPISEPVSDKSENFTYPWEKVSKRKKPNYFLIVSLIILLVGGGYYFLQKVNPVHHPVASSVAARMNVITTKYGSKSQITLPDSTQVWLNSGSKLTYENDFAESPVREVYLSGEAFFDVTHRNNQPFVIHTQKIDVRVLGTAFDIRSYPGDKTTETTLLRGAIEVSLHENPAHKIILKPNEKITIYNDRYSLNDIAPIKPLQQPASDTETMFTISHIHPITADSIISETSWIDNKLIFQGEAFDDLARQMERKYNVKFHFENDKIRQYHYTGTFTTESIDQALHALEISSPLHPFRFHINKQDVYIYLNKKDMKE